MDTEPSSADLEPPPLQKPEAIEFCTDGISVKHALAISQTSSLRYSKSRRSSGNCTDFCCGVHFSSFTKSLCSLLPADVEPSPSQETETIERCIGLGLLPSCRKFTDVEPSSPQALETIKFYIGFRTLERFPAISQTFSLRHSKSRRFSRTAFDFVFQSVFLKVRKSPARAGDVGVVGWISYHMLVYSLVDNDPSPSQEPRSWTTAMGFWSTTLLYQVVLWGSRLLHRKSRNPPNTPSEFPVKPLSNSCGITDIEFVFRRYAVGRSVNGHRTPSA